MSKGGFGMKIKMNTKNFISKGVKALAVKTAKNDMNSTCVCFQYQPKLPKSVKKSKLEN